MSCTLTGWNNLTFSRKSWYMPAEIFDKFDEIGMPRKASDLMELEIMIPTYEYKNGNQGQRKNCQQR